MFNFYIKLSKIGKLFVWTFVIVVFLSICIEYNFSIVKRKQRTVPPLGNYLSIYYYAKTAAKSKGFEKIRNRLQYPIAHDKNMQNFYQKLLWQPNDVLVEYRSKADAAWSYFDPNGVAKPNFLKFIQMVRQQSRNEYANALPPVHTSLPVMHFRCSDSPFNKHFMYHMAKDTTVRWMAEHIKQRGFDKIIMLNCSQHRGIDPVACSRYAKHYKDVLVSEGLEVFMHCGTVIEDFALMVRSPLLLSLGASSYSFMAGISKDPSNYISCNTGMEIDGKYYLVPASQVDWIIDEHAPVLNAQVDNFSNVEAVLKLLDS